MAQQYFGKIKFYNIQKAFGFIIEKETNAEYFFHISGMVDIGEEPQKDNQVSFELIDGKKGKNAVSIIQF